MIPFSPPRIDQAVIDEVTAALRSGWITTGPRTKQFEKEITAYCGAKTTIAVSAWTTGMEVLLRWWGVGPGDEVITTSFTFAATAEVIVLVGAKPVFVDIDPATCNIDPALIEAKITSRTKAIMPVSLYGQAANLDAINEIAARHGNLPVIEDAAQSFGATSKGRKSCNLSSIGCTSFFPSKPLGCYGDGGAIFTNDDAIAQACREIRVHGQSKRYTHTRVGVGGRMDTLQCAVVLAKLERFEWEIAQRIALGQRYIELIQQANIPVRLIHVEEGNECVWGQFTIMLDNREAVQAKLQEAGVPTAVHYPIPMNQQPAYAHLCCPDCTPLAAKAGQRVMSLPFSPDVSEATQVYVVQELAKAIRSVA